MATLDVLLMHGKSIDKRESCDEYSEVWCTLGEARENNEAPITMLIYSIYPSSIERALKEVGFVGIERRPMLLSEEGKAYFTVEEVSDSLSHVYAFVARKSA